jgi:hypothetical protein
MKDKFKGLKNISLSKDGVEKKIFKLTEVILPTKLDREYAQWQIHPGQKETLFFDSFH